MYNLPRPPFLIERTVIQTPAPLLLIERTVIHAQPPRPPTPERKDCYTCTTPRPPLLRENPRGSLLKLLLLQPPSPTPERKDCYTIPRPPLTRERLTLLPSVTQIKYFSTFFVQGTYTHLLAKFVFKRRLAYSFIQIYAPTCLIVCMSWMSFWIHRDAVPARVSLGITTVLTIVTLMGSLRGTVPKVCYPCTIAGCISREVLNSKYRPRGFCIKSF